MSSINPISIYTRSTTPKMVFEMHFDDYILFKNDVEAQQFLKTASNHAKAHDTIGTVILVYKNIINFYKTTYPSEAGEFFTNEKKSIFEDGTKVINILKESPQKISQFNKLYGSFELLYEQARVKYLGACQNINLEPINFEIMK
jgi:hypothetical protein